MNTRPPATPLYDIDDDIERRLGGDLSLDETEPVEPPGDADDERNEYGYPKQTEQAAEDGMFPLHDSFLKLRKAVVTGSCCGSVAFLLLVSGWDHGWIPGLKSPFAKSDDLNEFKIQGEDVKRLVVLGLAQAIRETEQELCIEYSVAKQQRLDELQYQYIARTGQRYPHTDCRKS